MVKNKQWSLKPYSQPQVDLLSKQLNITPLVAHLLVTRGLSEISEAHIFLFNSLKDLPNPFLLKDMEKAVNRILLAMEQKEKILIYGDYDVDGTVASSILLLFFKEIGYEVDFYIPHRMKEGYSLNSKALQKIKEKGTKVVITVDNGIAAVEEAKTALELGLDLIITDHHEVPAIKPLGFAIINPRQSDCSYPDKNICGSGVAFNLILALRQRLREQGFFKMRAEPNLRKFLDLLAIATVADVVPLKGVNRIFVKNGLQEISKTAWPGIRALIKVCHITGEITASQLGFKIGPRLNACGRLYDASIGVRLLTSTDEDKAYTLAIELDKANQERQGIEQGILKEALSLVEEDSNKDRFSYVLFNESWHPGVIGIVASRIMDRYSRPVILMGRDGENLKGSGRCSFVGLHLVEMLKDCAKDIIRYGGHRAAAGLSLDPKNLESFKMAFEASVRQRISSVDHFQPYLLIDSELNLRELNLKLIDEINLLAPYGEGNSEPVFCLKGITPLWSKIVGQTHLKFQLQSPSATIEAIAFGMSDQINNLTPNMDMVFYLKVNNYQGLNSVSLQVKDLHGPAIKQEL